jgi:hypothetical protein
MTTSHWCLLAVRRVGLLWAVATCCLLGGCNQPAVSLKPPAFQPSENTVRDWDDVAQAIATGMAARGLLPTPGQPPPPPSALTPVYLRLCAPDSAFVVNVATALEADILERGGTVARTPNGATVVNLDVDWVKWGPRDKPPGLLGTTAALLLTPAIVIGASVPMATWTAADAAGATAAGVGVLADLLIAITPTMNAEAVWEATIITNDRVVMDLRAPVYVRERDLPLYNKVASLGPRDSWESNTPLGVRRIRLDP